VTAEIQPPDASFAFVVLKPREEPVYNRPK
jgi:hypothetical protein